MNTMSVTYRGPSLGEFIALVASMTALVALSIDAMLPALPAIGKDLGVRNANDAQLVISFIFIGMSVGPLFFGPLSDSIGRKKAIYLGLILFVIGSVVGWIANSFEQMLVGRVIQGIGVAGPRIVAMAMVRDRFKGNEMARVMSFVTAVFIIVPAIAPSVGQAVLKFSSWREIFLLFIVISIIIWVWLAMRQPETLLPENKHEFNLPSIFSSCKIVFSNKKSMYFTVATGLTFGSFLGYLNSSQQIFQGIYGVGELFPVYFAVLALGFGASSLINARLVMKFGMHQLANTAIKALIFVSLIFFVLCLVSSGVPHFLAFMTYAMLAFMFVAITFGNLNAMAMEPLGKVAGIGAAFVSATSTIIALPIGISIGQNFDSTLTPVALGFTLCSTLAWVAMSYGERS